MCVAVCCSVLQCVAVCCSVLQCVGQSRGHNDTFCLRTTLQSPTLHHIAAHCNTLHRIAAHCNTLQHTATLHTMHCSTPQHTALHRIATHLTATLRKTPQHTAIHHNTLCWTTHAASRRHMLPTFVVASRRRMLSNMKRHMLPTCVVASSSLNNTCVVCCVVYTTRHVSVPLDDTCRQHETTHVADMCRLEATR